MKKKLTIYYILLFGILFLMMLSSSFSLFISKKPTDAKTYTAIIEALGLKVEDKTIQTKDKNPLVQEFVSQNNNYQLRFAVLDNPINAKTALRSLNSEIKKQASSQNKNEAVKVTSQTSQTGKNFKIITSKIKNDYIYLSQVDNTVLLMISNKNNKEILNELANKLGYGFEYFEEMFSFSLSFLILFILLCCVPSAYIFKKASKKPYLAFIPFVNDYCLCKIADKNGWKMLLLLIPAVNIVYRVILSLRLSTVFKKSDLFGVGIFFLPLIFLPILAFDDSEYIGLSEKE